MSRPRFISLLLISLPFPLFGQAYTLEQCIERARVENMAVQLAITSKELCSWEFRQAKDAFLPSLNVSNQHNASVGRALDPTTYQFVTSQTVYDMSAMIGGSVTLFSGLERVYQLKKAAVRSSKLEYDRLLLSLDKEVKQAVVQINTAYEKYNLLTAEVRKAEEALRETEKKYDVGAVTYYDYHIAVGNLYQAKAELLRARYEYIYRMRVILYYAGEPLC